MTYLILSLYNCNQINQTYKVPRSYFNRIDGIFPDFFPLIRFITFYILVHDYFNGKSANCKKVRFAKEPSYTPLLFQLYTHTTGADEN